MSIIFATNQNNDIFATSTNRLALLRGLPAVLQHCRHAVEARRGEMIYARERGIEYLTNVFDGAPNVLQFEAQVRQAIVRIPNVVSIVSFESEIIDNRLTYTIIIRTTFGTGTVDGNI